MHSKLIKITSQKTQLASLLNTLPILDKKEFKNAAAALVIWQRLQAMGNPKATTARLQKVLERYQNLCIKYDIYQEF